MSPCDLLAHGLDVDDSFETAYKSWIVSFSDEELVTLMHVEARMMDVLERCKCRVMQAMPVEFLKLRPIRPANDLPHTLGGTIILGDAFFRAPPTHQTITLLHEQIHVFQRKHPGRAREIVQRHFGSTVLKEGISPQTRARLRMRANPDLDDAVYADVANGTASYQAYNSDTPHCLGDSSVQGPGPTEHPFETMAYQLSERMVRGDMDPRIAHLM